MTEGEERNAWGLQNEDEEEKASLGTIIEEENRKQADAKAREKAHAEALQEQQMLSVAIEMSLAEYEAELTRKRRETGNTYAVTEGRGSAKGPRERTGRGPKKEYWKPKPKGRRSGGEEL